MVRGNAYAATKAALEAHAINLTAELRGTGLTANAYRPGRVETAMQVWIRSQDSASSGTCSTRGGVCASGGGWSLGKPCWTVRQRPRWPFEATRAGRAVDVHATGPPPASQPRMAADVPSGTSARCVRGPETPRTDRGRRDAATRGYAHRLPPAEVRA